MSGGSGTGRTVIIPAPGTQVSAFKDQILTDLGVFFNASEFAETLQYTPQGGNLQYIWAIVDFGSGDDYGGTGTIYERAKLHVAASGDYGLTYAKKGDTVVINGIAWTVDLAQKTADGITWEIELVK